MNAPPPVNEIPVPPPPDVQSAPLTSSLGSLPSASFASTGKVALLLPLSGPSTAAGQALLEAAQLALFEIADDQFTLLPYDTQGTPEGAQAAVRQAIANHADIILGPLFSAEVKAAAPVALASKIPLIAFSADRTAAGSGVYILGFLPGPQALRTADYAATNYPRLAILAPNNEYGRIVVDTVENGAGRVGGGVRAVEFYDPSAADFAGPIQRLAKPDPRNPGDIGFDALLLPDEGDRLRRLAATLPLFGVDPAHVKLLGTMLWEDSNPGAEPALAGGWYPAPPTAEYAGFAQRFQKTFGSAPPRIAGLAYDATALAAVLERQPNHSFTTADLTNPNGFAGVDGLFRLRQDGTAERGYAILQVAPNGGAPQEIDAAPASFPAPASN